ncbi:unnamed protein product [Amoebophrya sp. A120]|nr:unnamed protein product [Amoebophrya sp. A120]|eukprot:GSA120T00013825001.1
MKALLRAAKERGPTNIKQHTSHRDGTQNQPGGGRISNENQGEGRGAPSIENAQVIHTLSSASKEHNYAANSARIEQSHQQQQQQQHEIPSPKLQQGVLSIAERVGGGTTAPKEHHYSSSNGNTFSVNHEEIIIDLAGRTSRSSASSTASANSASSSTLHPNVRVYSEVISAEDERKILEFLDLRYGSGGSSRNSSAAAPANCPNAGAGGNGVVHSSDVASTHDVQGHLPGRSRKNNYWTELRGRKVLKLGGEVLADGLHLPCKATVPTQEEIENPAAPTPIDQTGSSSSRAAQHPRASENLNFLDGQDHCGQDDPEDFSFPPFLRPIAKQIGARFFPSAAHCPNHLLINCYQPGDGIMPHQDGPLYHPIVAILSLKSQIVFDFIADAEQDGGAEANKDEGVQLEDNAEVDVHDPAATSITKSKTTSLCLPRRSLLIFEKEAYEKCKHGISFQKFDFDAGNEAWEKRGERISLTFRYVPLAMPMGQQDSSFSCSAGEERSSTTASSCTSGTQIAALGTTSTPS